MPKGSTKSAPTPGPQMWMLGSGIHGADWAAELGPPFSHAYFINADGTGRGGGISRVCRAPPARRQGLARRRGAVRRDRGRCQAPRRVAHLWAVRLLSGRPILPRPEARRSHAAAGRKLLGSVACVPSSAMAPRVREQLTALALAHGADELVSPSYRDYASRLRSYELLAAALGLASASMISRSRSRIPPRRRHCARRSGRRRCAISRTSRRRARRARRRRPAGRRRPKRAG